MNGNDWLPKLLTLQSHNGDWESYTKSLHQIFNIEYMAQLPRLGGHEVKITATPPVHEFNPTFWHIISIESETSKQPEHRVKKESRCERMLWPKAIINAASSMVPSQDGPVKWWANERKGDKNLLISLDDFSYLVVLKRRCIPATGKSELVLWTGYDVEFNHTRKKNRKEYEAYWAARKK